MLGFLEDKAEGVGTGNSLAGNANNWMPVF